MKTHFTTDQLRAGYARNARGLRTLLAKAEKTGRTVNGMTAEYLRTKVAEYEAWITATDAALRAHLTRKEK